MWIAVVIAVAAAVGFVITVVAGSV